MRIQTGTPWLADGYRFKLFEDESLKQASVKPTEKDNFLLHPRDVHDTFVEFNVGASQSSDVPLKPSATQRRIKSASSVRLQDRPWQRSHAPQKYPSGFVPRSRPSSAIPQKSRPLSGTTPTQRRIKSASSARTRAEIQAHEHVDELRKGFTLVNKLYENKYRSTDFRLHPASPAPDYRYFDRHARCYNHTHAHRGVISECPQKACEKFLESCGSRAISPARPSDIQEQPHRRYIDYHRPRTAPGTRTELQYIPRPSYVYRGHQPHFCNFVQQVHLHSKQISATDSTGIPESELDDDIEFITESVDGRLVNKWRKNSNGSSRSSRGSLGLISVPRLDDYDSEAQTAPDSIPEMKEDGTISGTEGRPGSPSSVDGESKVDLDSSLQNPVTGVEVRVTSPTKSESSVKYSPKSNDGNKEILESPIFTGSERFSPSDPDVNEQPDKVTTKARKGSGDGSQKRVIETFLIPSGTDSDNNNNDRPPSPRQPPPSPEPIKPPPVPATPPSTSKKRGCVNKKTKKPIERVRKMKEIEVPKEPDPSKVEDQASASSPTLESDRVDSKVDLKVPDLPSTPDKKDKLKKDKNKPKKHLIEAENDLLKEDPADLLNEQMKQLRSEVDWSNMDTNGMDELKRQPQIKSWIQGRLALSQQSSRFELPMDMKNLETMTPQEYIKKHCIITSRRQNLYQKIFLKNKDKSHVILFKDLDKTLKDVLVHTITSEQVQSILNMLDINENTKVDYKLFAGMAAYAERVLYPKFVTHKYLERLIELQLLGDLLGTEDTHDMPEYQKEKIECADFCALDWKFHGIKVNPKMVTLLKQIS